MRKVYKLVASLDRGPSRQVQIPWSDRSEAWEGAGCPVSPDLRGSSHIK